MDNLVQRLKLALIEILEEVNHDCLNCEHGWDIVATAASDALDDIERASEDPLPF